MSTKCILKSSVCRILLALLVCAGLLPAARAVSLVQEFYLPMPEQQIYTANNSIIAGTGSTIASTFSIIVTGNGTEIYYDQWEDGYETDLSNPTQPTTHIWGDGNDADGIPPGFAHNPLGLPAGTIITLTNNVSLPRNPSTILWDARDRIAANKAIIITRAGWPIPTGPVFAGAVSVLSTIDYGTNYISPVGQNLANNLFKYVGMSIMAAQDNTAVTIDPNGNGIGTTNIVLNQGESYLVNGGIMKGGRVTATKPIQADLIIGHVGASYASDWFTLYPVSAWSSSYYTPVGSAATINQPAYVYLYNPGTSAITINYNTKVGSGSFSVPGTNGVYQFQMPVGSGASFVSAGGQNFYALCTVAANNSSDTAYNWGFTLVPQGALTTEADVGWAPGSADGTVDGSPVWVTALANTKLYVDYKGDHAGPLTDPNGNKYDTNFTVTALQSQKIFDPSKNQTGMRVYTVDSTLITAAWGEDPDTAQPGNPYIDAGYTVLPFPVPVLKKTAAFITYTNPPGLSIGDVIQYTVEVDNKGLLPLGNTVVIDAPSGNLTYVTNSTVLNSNSIPDNASGQPFPLAGPGGYNIPVILSQGVSTFQYLAKVNAGGVVSNNVSIGGTTISTSTVLTPSPTNGASVSLNFSDTNGVPVSLYAAGARVFVTMTNAVGNTASNSVQTISVTVLDTNTLDLETIILTETGTNTGIFRNLSGLPTSTTSGLSQQDGTLNVAPGDTLSVSYTDPTYGDSASSTASILVPTPNKQLYLSVNGSTNGTQALNRYDPVAYGHGPTHTSVDLNGGLGMAATIGVDGSAYDADSNNFVFFNYTTGSGTNLLMLVSVGVNNTVAVSSVSYGFTGLTLVTNTPSNGNKSEIYLYSLTNPPSGSHLLIVSLASSDNVVVGVNTFSNVSLTTPLGIAVASSSGSVTVSTATNGLVFGTISSDGAITDASGQTDFWKTNANAVVYAAGSQKAAGGATNVAMTWNGGAHSGSIGVSINPALTVGGGGGTNVTTFTQAPVFSSAFTMSSNNVITITNYITVTNGVMPASPAITATLQYNGTKIITLSNPTYSAASSNLVWSGTLASNVTVPAGQAISYVISNGQSGVVFHINYDSTNNPSKITLPASTVIQVNTLGIYDAPYPNGNLVTTPIAGSTLYIRANVSDPFGNYDITSLGLAVTGPSPSSSFTNTLTGANVVATNGTSETYEYQWVTGPTTGSYNIAATAHEGTEGVTATAAASITTTFNDLGTPSTTEFTAGPNGVATNSYTGGSLISVLVSDLNRNTNAATIDSVSVTVTSSSGDLEVLTLFETGTNTGVFTNSIASSTNVVGTANNGNLYAPVGSILTASYTDPTDPSDSTSATATIQPASGVPGIVMNKTILSPSGGQVGVGQSVTFNLQAVNIGSTTLPNLSVNDMFPSAKLSYSSASLAPSTTGSGMLTWTNLGALMPGQSTNITVTFTTLATGAVTNFATANGVTATNSSSVTLLVNQAAVNVVKTLLSPTNTPVAVGSNVVFRITVQNVGNTTITYLPMEDTFSGAYYQFVSSTITNNGSGAGSLIWTNLAYPAALATNAIITNDVTMKVVGQGSPANNTATVDFATDIFGNPVPTSSSTIGVNTATASINGHVYNDVNQNGIYTNGDTGLANVTLQLYTDPNGDGDPSDGTLVQVTTTDGNGYYEMLNLSLGHYVVVATTLPGYVSSAPPNNRVALNLTTLTVSTNNNFFQYVPAPSVYSTISGTVWYDSNGNGTNDLGETNIANVEIDLVSDANSNGIVDSGESVVASVNTDTNGNYSFAGVTPGHYVIREVNPFGYYSTGDSQSRTDGQISFVSTNGIVSTNNSFYSRLSPVAVNDTNTAVYFSPVTIYPLTNDVSPNGDPLTISNATSTNGIVVINPGSTNLTFTPTNIGTATITYTAADAHGGTSSAVISISVSPSPLVITANGTSKVYGQSLTFAGTEFTASGLTNGDTVTSVSLSSPGSVNTAGAGSYGITATNAIGIGLGNYTIVYNAGTLTVNPAMLGITANSTNRVYGTTNPVFTYTASGLVNGDTTNVLSGSPSLTTPALTNSPVGTYAIVATNGTLSATNYSLSFTNGLLTVQLAAPIVTWPVPTNIVYGTPLGTNQNNATSSVPGNYTYNPTNGTVLPVGTNSLSVSYTPTDTNYAATNLSVKLVVTPAPLIVTANNAGKTYGQTNPVPGGTLTGVVSGDGITATFVTTATTASPAGSYPITPVLSDPNSKLANYNVTTNLGTLTVNPAMLGITANSTNRVYGTTNPVFTYTASGLVNGDTTNVLSGSPSLTTPALTNSPVGTYAIVATNGTLSATNYSLSFTNGLLTVQLAAPIVTWPVPTNIVYGTPLGTNQNNATSSVPGNYTYNPTNGTVLPVGTNSLSVSYTPTDTNYAATNLSVKLVVTPAPLIVTANNAGKTYGQTNPVPGGTLTGVVSGDGITATFVTTATTASPAGSYPITPVLSDPNSKLANYNVTTNLGTLTVNPAMLGITANSTNRVYGTTNPVFTYTASGLVNGDTTNVLSGSPSLTTPALTNSPVGTYAIVATNGTLSATNYSLSFTNGLLTVQLAAPIVTWPVPTNIVYGTPLGTNQNNATSSVPGNYTYNPTNGTVLPVGTNSLSVSYTPTDTNYAATNLSVKLVVTPAPLIVTANNAGKTYGQTNPVPGGTLTGVVSGDGITATFVTTATTASPAGSYPITPVLSDPNSKLANYNVTTNLGTLTVNPAMLGITANSTNRVYGTTNPVFTYTASGLVNGDTTNVLSGSPSLTTPALTNSPVGTYAIVATNGTLSATNYSLSFTNGLLTVQLAAPIVTWPVPTNIVYGTPLGTNQNNATSSVPGNYTYNPTNGTVLPVGTNSLSVSYTPTDTNYAATNLSVKLVVTPAPLIVTANNAGKTYGQTLTLGPGQTNFTSSGLVNGDTVGSVTLASSGADSAAAPGSYALVPSLATGGTFAASNYSITYSNGTLTVGSAADLVVLLNGPASIILGSSFVYTITVTNAGPSTSSNVVVSDSLPLGLTFVAASSGGVFSNNIVTWPLIASLPFGAVTNFSITNQANALGSITNFASAVAATYDPTANNNSDLSSISVVYTAAGGAQFGISAGTNTVQVGTNSWIVGSSAFNPQTGLFEEPVTVTNTGATTVAGVRLYVSGLRSGVTLYNATGTTNGTPYAEYDASLNPDSTVTFALEFYDVNRLAFTNTLTAVAVLPANLPTAGTNGVLVATEFMDTRIAGDTRFVIEFPTIPGKSYTILYATNVNATVWNIATPAITANANVTQWYDDGPPKTISPPLSVSSRYYRVIQN